MSMSLGTVSQSVAQPTSKDVSSLIVKTETSLASQAGMTLSLPVSLDFLSAELKDLAKIHFSKMMEIYTIENGLLVGRVSHKNSSFTPQSLHEMVQLCFHNLGGKAEGYFKCGEKDSLVIYKNNQLKIFQIIKSLLKDPKDAKNEVYSVFSFHEAKQRVLKKVKKKQFNDGDTVLIVEDEFRKMCAINPENRLWGMVKNPLCQVTIQESQFCGIIMKYYDQDLFEYNDHNKQLKIEDFLCVFHQILSVVSYIHKLGAAHRDIKPENILCKKDVNGLNRFALTDWASFISNKEWSNIRIIAHEYTPTYAPVSEREKTSSYDSNKSVKVGQALDAYAIGCTMFETITGARPYDEYDVGQGKKRCYVHILSKYEAISPKKAPREITDLIYDLIEQDPNKRGNVVNAFKIINELMASKYPVLYEKLNNKIKTESALLG